MKVTAVIPARNEARNIERVIREARAYVDEVLVIDGRSTDETCSVAQAAGARVVVQTSTGKGGAIVEAGQLVESGIIVFLDADQSHDPADIPLLTAPLLADDADLVIGSRMLGGSDELFTGIREFTRLVGGHVLTLMIAKRFKYPLTDSQNGFRAITVSTLRDLPLRQTSFTIEMEMCIEALRGGYRVLEIPTHEFRRSSGASNINPLKLGPKYVWVCTRAVMRPLRPGASVAHDAAFDAYRPEWRRVGTRGLAPDE